MRAPTRTIALLIAAGAITGFVALLTPPPPRASSVAPGPRQPAEIPDQSQPARAEAGVVRIPPSAAEIARGGALRGRVLLPKGSAPPPKLGVLVRPSRFLVRSEGAATRDLPVAADLSFAFEGLPFASYDVQAHASGWTGIPSSVELSPLEPAAHAAIRIVPSPSLAGVVRDETRAPLESVRIGLVGITDLGAAVDTQTLTAADGRFRFMSIADGRYTLSIGPEVDPLRPPIDVSVVQAAAPELTVDVPAPGSLEITIVAEGTDFPLEGFEVTTLRTSPEAKAHVGLTGSDGRVEHRTLRPGPYSIVGSRREFTQVRSTVAVEPGKIARVRLEAFPFVEGLVPISR
jgi:hypothetical protein